MEASKRRSLLRSNRKSQRAQEMAEDCRGCRGGGGGDGDIAEEEYDVEAWDTLSSGFKRAQVVLDQNRDLIQRVNDNHRSRIADNLASNVGLINEINGNISKVLEIYSDLSVNFTNIVHERRRTAKNGDTTTSTTGGQSSSGS
ncbi:PREDICTED: protein ELF4-LIKE 1 [Tarenaya hassleriana]|uniref:protein ELF4-LIKE 1 n=1 Tax=Tarenaya hassleriana TaxID=28532 RepID=UPI00053C43E8|nr:PREDICTED: protein ELF4-LIKE 1 [Tarenaya hassleriana]XP_010521949.1 PREDICTED: protein ELF4-LIKE 1 [Tarenaya hassleriana]